MTIRLISALLLLATFAGDAGASEEVLAFNTDIEVKADGTLIVVDEMTVRAEGDQIKRGIIFERQTHFRLADGTTRTVVFEVEAVLRDGKPHPYHIVREPGLAKVYIGKADVFIPPGVYTYSLRYRLTCYLYSRTLYDELEWATGNWTFPILGARIRVTLPPGALVLYLDGFTGSAGQRGSDFRVAARSASGFTVETTRPFAPGEAVTITARWQRGMVAPCQLVS